MVIMGAWFIGNMIATNLMSTGAFEIFYDGQLVGSRTALFVDYLSMSKGVGPPPTFWRWALNVSSGRAAGWLGPQTRSRMHVAFGVGVGLPHSAMHVAFEQCDAHLRRLNVHNSLLWQIFSKLREGRMVGNLEEVFSLLEDAMARNPARLGA
jgi:hypothetical protein